MRNNGAERERKESRKPYAMVGSGQLVSSIWKTGNEEAGRCYHMNVFRMAKNGRVGQRFKPQDLEDQVKLVQALAATLALPWKCSLSRERVCPRKTEIEMTIR